MILKMCHIEMIENASPLGDKCFYVKLLFKFKKEKAIHHLGDSHQLPIRAETSQYWCGQLNKPNVAQFCRPEKKKYYF